MFSETLVQIGKAVVEANNKGETDALLNSHYADHAVSVEAAAFGEDGPETVGLDAIRGKHAWWESAFEMHSASAEGPFFHGDDRFSVIFKADTTNRETGERSQMHEVAVFTVADGKIVREEFYYTAE